jgi:hypothetical protein
MVLRLGKQSRSVASCFLQQFGPVLWRKRLHFRNERGLGCCVERGWGRGAGRNRNANFQKELFLASWRANAHQPRRVGGSVSKLVRCVGWDMYGFARSHYRRWAAEGGLDFAFEDAERLLEIMPVSRRAASGRNMHVDEAESARSLFSRKENRICISHQTDVSNVGRVRARGGEFSAEVIGRKIE